MADPRIVYARQIATKLRDAAKRLDLALSQAVKERRKIDRMIRGLTQEVGAKSPDEAYVYPSLEDRNARIYEARMSGRKMSEIASEYALSASRTWQIFYKEEARRERAERKRQRDAEEDNRLHRLEVERSRPPPPSHVCPPHIWSPFMDGKRRDARQCTACLLIEAG